MVIGIYDVSTIHEYTYINMQNLFDKSLIEKTLENIGEFELFNSQAPVVSFKSKMDLMGYVVYATLLRDSDDPPLKPICAEIRNVKKPVSPAKGKKTNHNPQKAQGSKPIPGSKWPDSDDKWDAYKGKDTWYPPGWEDGKRFDPDEIAALREREWAVDYEVMKAKAEMELYKHKYRTDPGPSTTAAEILHQQREQYEQMEKMRRAVEEASSMPASAILHKKYKYGVPVLLTGEKGSGKTTLAMQLAKGMNLQFFNISMTRQTTLSHLLGFMSVNGTYVPSQLRKVAENGGLFLIDEIDAGDANVLLTLNTIENGFISFPDGIIELHPDFRLVATSNPQGAHNDYVGRNKLDAATLDRFDIIDIDHDDELEKTLVDHATFQHIDSMRKALKAVNSSIVISMRDAVRLQNRTKLGLTEGFMFRLCDKNKLVMEDYTRRVESVPKHSDQADCLTFGDLVGMAEVKEK
jgi:hypothetical protein